MGRAHRRLADLRVRTDVLLGRHPALWVLNRVSLDAGTIRLAARYRIHGWCWFHATTRRTRQRRYRLLTFLTKDKSLGRHHRDTAFPVALDGGIDLDVITIRSLLLGDS